MERATAKKEEGGFVDDASNRVQEATSVAQERASELREQGSIRLREQVDQRSTEVGSQVRSLAEALRRSGDDLGNEGNTAQLTSQAADRLERMLQGSGHREVSRIVIDQLACPRV